ncbi:MAG TPA: epimerase, partial [Rhodospirillaceae bacterium]|nr:epimerase [Rhodospirillaceae bacterium]
MKPLITGASGFIGQNLTHSFAKEADLRLLVRQPTGDPRERKGDLLDKPSLEQACAGRDIVFHCAGYAHAFDVSRAEEEKRHHQINFEGAENVARAASAAGVKRFVFLSSVKAMGEPYQLCVDETFDALPETAYGKAKRSAEESLCEIARQTGMEIVCLRLAMVYGKGSHGNLDRMAAMVRKG